jgi:hypothetical protein
MPRRCYSHRLGHFHHPQLPRRRAVICGLAAPQVVVVVVLSFVAVVVVTVPRKLS